MTALFAERYKVLEKIGAGGMGQVYKAEDTLLQSIVALKTLNKGGLTDDQVLRFQREAKALAALSHPNIVPIYIFDITKDGRPYIVMRLAQGQTLSTFIDESSSLDLHTCLEIFIQICEAMEHAHRNGILHRDLKPGNIMLAFEQSESPKIVVIDFGLAMIESGNAFDSLTKSGVIMGSPAYMSPEQINGAELDARSDIYSLGCIMYETLTGKKPYIAECTLELLKKKTNQKAPGINDVKPAFSKELEATVSRTLELSADDRFQSMSDLRQALLSLDLTEGSQEEVNARSAAGGRHTLPMIAGLIVVLSLVVVGAGVVLLKAPEAEAPVKPDRSSNEFPDKDGATIEKGLRSGPGLFLQTGRVWAEDGQMYLTDVTDNEAQRALQKCPTNKPIFELTISHSSVGACFEKCPHTIEIVRLADIDRIETKGWIAISRLPKLKQVTLKAVRLQPETVELLLNSSSLKAIAINKCILDSPSLDLLACSKLLTLSLTNVMTTDSRLSQIHPLGDKAFEKLTANCRNLQTLEWVGMPLSSEALMTAANLPKLCVLRLKKLGITDDHLAKLRFKNLATLDLTENDTFTANGLTDFLLHNRMKVKKVVFDSSDKSFTSSAEEQLVMQARDNGTELRRKTSQ